MNLLRPKQILFLIALVWPFGQIFELPFLGSARLYLLDLLVLALSLSLLSKKTLQSIKSDSLFKPLAYFFLIAAFSLLLALPNLSLEGGATAALYLFRWLTYTSIYFALRTIKFDQKVFKVILASLAAFTLLGLAQYLFLPDTRFLFYLGFDDHFYRLIGTFLDPNFTGLALLIFVFLLLSRPKYKYLALFPVVALALTYSRATYLTGLITVVYLLLRTPKKSYLLGIPIVLLIVYLAPKPYGEGVNLLRTFSITSRLQDSAAGLQLLNQKPLFGHGFNTLRSIKVTDGVLPNRAAGGFSNSFIFILVTTGIFGFLAYLNLLYHALRQTWSYPHLNASLLAIILHSFFNNSLFYIWLMVLFWLITSYKKPGKVSR